ncbi:MAG: hypothetical protein ACK4Y5_00725 [Acetobacteraceae bacterium]|jgi:hypothetical protein
MLINVTARDIKLGIPCSKQSCPIARAIRRRFPRSRIKVHAWCLTINRRIISTTPQVTRFINALDDGKRVRPFKFDLPIK